MFQQVKSKASKPLLHYTHTDGSRGRENKLPSIICQQQSNTIGLSMKAAYAPGTCIHYPLETSAICKHTVSQKYHQEILIRSSLEGTFTLWPGPFCRLWMWITWKFTKVLCQMYSNTVLTCCTTGCMNTVGLYNRLDELCKWAQPRLSGPARTLVTSLRWCAQQGSSKRCGAFNQNLKKNIIFYPW